MWCIDDLTDYQQTRKEFHTVRGMLTFIACQQKNDNESNSQF